MQDRELKLTSGWAAMVAVLLGLGLIVLLITLIKVKLLPGFLWPIVLLLSLAWIFSLFGFVVNGPNQARVVQLFGKYIGTVKDVGFFYGIPLYWRTKVSLRIRTFETGMS